MCVFYWGEFTLFLIFPRTQSKYLLCIYTQHLNLASAVYRLGHYWCSGLQFQLYLKAMHSTAHMWLEQGWRSEQGRQGTANTKAPTTETFNFKICKHEWFCAPCTTAFVTITEISELGHDPVVEAHGAVSQELWGMFLSLPSDSLSARARCCWKQ